MCCQPPDVEEQNAYLKAEVDNLENDLEVEVDAHARLVSTNARLRKAQTEADRVLALAQEEFKDRGGSVMAGRTASEPAVASIPLKRCPDNCVWVPERHAYVTGHCSQCGKRFVLRACGPTHAILAEYARDRVACRRCKGAGMVTA